MTAVASSLFRVGTILFVVARLSKTEVLSVDDGGPFYAQVGSYVAFNCSFGCSVNYDTSWCAIWNYTVSKASLITCSNTPASWTDFSSKFNASTENDVTNSCWLVLRFVAEPELNNAMFACRRTLNVPVSGATNIYEYRLPRLLQQLKVSPSSTLSSLSTSINIKSSYSTGNPSGSSIRPSLSTVITSEYPSQSIMASITQMSSIPNLSGAPPTSILVVPSSSTSCGSLCTPAYGQLPSVSTAVSSTLGLASGLGLSGCIIVVETVALVVIIIAHIFACRIKTHHNETKNDPPDVIANHFAGNPKAAELITTSPC